MASIGDSYEFASSNLLSALADRSSGVLWRHARVIVADPD